LEKVPENRISISDIRLHPWVTSNGSVQLISKDENCKLVERVTQNDVQNAIKPIKSSLFTVMKAASKFRSKTTKSFLSKIK
jgi:[calcium/calmodulin-dependent protein kinase] kinase